MAHYWPALLMRILLIEDENKTAAYLAKGLGEAGFQVRTAADGESGLKLAMTESFDLLIDMRKQKAARAGAALHLTSKEFLLLTHLVHRAGEVVSRGEIAKQIWDIDFPINTNVVDVMVRRLRAKLDDPFKEKLVRTIRGVGYVLKSD